jgi:RNA polymerase sigma-70 factor, ECF subfamily
VGEPAAERSAEISAGQQDAEAIRRTLAGDRDAFASIVERHGRRVHDLARRILADADEAEDAAQQAFLNAYRALDRFDPRRPFRHWLLRITTNLCRNRLVARRHRPTPLAVGAEDDDAPLPPPAARQDDAAAEHGDDVPGVDAVRAALEALPERYRTTAVLRYVHGLDLAAIAEVTDDPVATVKTHLHRARAALATLLRRPPETGRPPGGIS